MYTLPGLVPCWPLLGTYWLSDGGCVFGVGERVPSIGGGQFFFALGFVFLGIPSRMCLVKG